MVTNISDQLLNTDRAETMPQPNEAMCVIERDHISVQELHDGDEKGLETVNQKSGFIPCETYDIPMEVVSQATNHVLSGDEGGVIDASLESAAFGNNSSESKHAQMMRLINSMSHLDQ
mmetsp:Transcript_29741/g.30161  ORF Transcript_29741/g.30161 Transcript_29741/m.30161 type:complete len:118 (-) Transcript_29741:1613-1966(-)